MGMGLQLLIDPLFCSFDTIKNAVLASKTLLNPIIDAMIMEGSYWLKNPCNCKELICRSTEECQAGSPLMDDVVYDNNMDWIVPQEIMCGFKQNNSIKVTQENTDSFHPTYQINPIHYANIWNNCSSIDDNQCVLNTSTVSQNVYRFLTKQDFELRIGAEEIRHKMVSRERCYEAINGGNVEEDFQICGKINQYVIDWAMKRIPANTMKRYQSFGEPLYIGPDYKSLTGLTWTWKNKLSFKRICNEMTHRYYTSVESSYTYLATIQNGCNFIAKSECGVHYCKLLSPVRVMEWVYLDGLRFNLSLATQNKSKFC